MQLPRPTSQGHKYILIMVDQASRWLELSPCFTTSSSETAQQIFRHIVANYGPPKALRFDRASTNTSKLMNIFLTKFNIKLIPSASSASQSNGLAERQILAVKTAIRLLCQTDADIEMSIGQILVALRASPSKTLGVSPFFARYGIDFDLLGFSSPFTPLNSLASKDQEFLTKFHKNLDTIRNAVKENVLQSKREMAQQYDKEHKVAEPPYKPGTFVLIKTPLKANSPSVLSHKPYSSDIHVVTEVVQNEHYGPGYRLTNTRTGQRRNSLFPAYKLKLFHSREPLLNKYKPDTGSNLLPDLKSAAASASPQATTQRDVSQDDSRNKPDENSSESPVVRILRQRGDNYLVERENKARNWIPRTEQLDMLIKQYLLKRENARKQRNANRKIKRTETQSRRPE